MVTGGGDAGGGDKMGDGVVVGGGVAELVGGGADAESGGIGVVALLALLVEGAGGDADAVVFCSLLGGVAIS